MSALFVFLPPSGWRGVHFRDTPWPRNRAIPVFMLSGGRERGQCPCSGPALPPSRRVFYCLFQVQWNKITGNKHSTKRSLIRAEPGPAHNRFIVSLELHRAVDQGTVESAALSSSDCRAADANIWYWLILTAGANPFCLIFEWNLIANQYPILTIVDFLCKATGESIASPAL